VAAVVEKHEARVGDVVEDRDRCHPALLSLRAMRRSPANCSRWPTTIEKVRFASDSPLEGDGFEPSAPRGGWRLGLLPRSYGKFRRAKCGSHLTPRWREMDSNFWYRGTKAVDFRSIPGIAGVSAGLLNDTT
jgi:hypothetical protein